MGMGPVSVAITTEVIAADPGRTGRRSSPAAAGGVGAECGQMSSADDQTPRGSPAIEDLTRVLQEVFRY